MKKSILLILFFLSSVFSFAQEPYTCDDFLHWLRNYYSFQVRNFVEMDDGSIVADLFGTYNCWDSVPQNKAYDYFLKLNKHADLLDSTLVSPPPVFGLDNAHTLLERNPNGEGYIWAKLGNNRIESAGGGKTWIIIRHADENMNFENFENSRFVLVEDTVVKKACNMMMEGDENIVAMYLRDGRPTFVRVGLDGTLKDKAVFNSPILNSTEIPYCMSVFNDSPREYAFHDWEVTENDTCLRYHVLDSLFNLKQTIVLPNEIANIRLVHNIDESNYLLFYYSIYPPAILPTDDNAWLVATQYKETGTPMNGVAVLKFDKTTQQCLGLRKFPSNPVYTDPLRMAYPIGLGKAGDGNIYFTYRTAQQRKNVSSVPMSRGRIAVAKLDSDLNIVWQRFCLNATGNFQEHCKMLLFEGGLVVGGYVYMDAGWENISLFFFNDDGTIGTPEMEANVHPYAFWPNPVDDRLSIQYSPDVQPTQIELYDLQGRLVRTQGKGLESINMEGLPAGTYTMRVVLENGKVYSNKVVKE